MKQRDMHENKKYESQEANHPCRGDVCDTQGYLIQSIYTHTHTLSILFARVYT